MMSDVEIEAMISEAPETIGRFSPRQLRPSSYVLRLGDRLLIPSDSPARVASYDDSTHAASRTSVAGKLSIGPGEFVLAASYEVLRLPADVAGQLFIGSRLARLGLFANAGATLVQAGFGHDEPAALTFELFNASRRSIELTVEMSFCHLALFRHTVPPTGPYRSRPEEHGCGPHPARFS